MAKAASKLSELKARILFLIGALIVFRIGTFIPVPGVDPIALADFFDQQAGNLLGLFNLFSGELSVGCRGVVAAEPGGTGGQSRAELPDHRLHHAGYRHDVPDVAG